ncbi:MAG: response regulator [Deltaproteobacteria bacterium]|nr:response regulator [Deltaproteobacteria bacterium]
MTETESNRLAQVLEYLVELSATTCSIEEQEIIQEKDPLWAQILAGISMLHETLVYQQAEALEQQEALSNAVQRSEKSSRAKSRFLAAMSHEIRTPLNAIVGLSQLSLAGGLQGVDRDNLRIINTAAKGLAELLTNALDLSKIDAHRVDVERVECDPARLVKQVAETFTLEAEEKGLKLTSTSDPDLPHRLRGDTTRLQQILANLTKNAIKFTHEGTVSIAAKLTGIDHALATVEFSVSDTGAGIAEVDHERIFTPFEQGNPRPTKAREGAGLGLALARGLADALEGTLLVQSQPGAGSTFSCEVPLEVVPLDAKVEPVVDHNEIIRRDTQRFAGSTVLLLEDNRFNRVYACRFLERFGVTVRCTKEGHEALEAFNGGPFDLVLLDLRLPGMDGLEVARRMRSLEGEMALVRVPLVAMTADVLQETRAACEEAGFDDFVSKPVDAKAFRELLCKWLGPGAVKLNA